jgi:hypothetical protein
LVSWFPHKKIFTKGDDVSRWQCKGRKKRLYFEPYITIRESFVFLRKGFGSSRALFFHKETRKPRVFKKESWVPGFLGSLWIFGCGCAALGASVVNDFFIRFQLRNFSSK